MLTLRSWSTALGKDALSGTAWTASRTGSTTPKGDVSGIVEMLFERSEFLIATCKKKKTDRLSVCPDIRLILVLVLGRQIVCGQNTVYLCLSKYIVFEKGNNQKRVYPVRLESKTGTAWNQVKNTLDEPRDWPKTNRTRFSEIITRVHL